MAARHTLASGNHPGKRPACAIVVGTVTLNRTVTWRAIIIAPDGSRAEIP
jgi:hypothetical protein